MNNHSRLQVALKEGKPVSIFDVKTGEACNCTCPYCGEKLIAKNKGKKQDAFLEVDQRIAHFQHKSKIYCEYASESALHILAKEVLEKNKTLYIPELILNGKKINENILLKFDEVETEKQIKDNISKDKIKVDALLKSENYTLIVEFKKTHHVDIEKKQKIKNLNLNCIEIDLNYIPLLDEENNINYMGILYLLENELKHKKWINNTKERVENKFNNRNYYFTYLEETRRLYNLYKNECQNKETPLVDDYFKSEFSFISVDENFSKENSNKVINGCPKNEGQISLNYCLICNYKKDMVEFPDGSLEMIVCGFLRKS